MYKINHCFITILASLCFTFVSCSKSREPKVLPPEIIQTSQFAPGWYTNDAQQLHRELDLYFALADRSFGVNLVANTAKALIVPHAGYYFSGLCAASAYQALLEPDSTLSIDERKNKTIKRVIILAPSHTTFYNGIALPDYTVYKTPLGDIPVDYKVLQKLEKSSLFRKYQLAHDKEHAVEMQLPLLQKTIQDFHIVPLVVGHMTPESVVAMSSELKKIIDDTTLVVVSSDFVHHGQDYEYKLFNQDILKNVRLIDSYASQAISLQSPAVFQDVLTRTDATICGREPLKILLRLLEVQAFGKVDAHLASYYTSAHMVQARSGNYIDTRKLYVDVPDQAAQNSVSYLGIVLSTPTVNKFVLTAFEKQALLSLARTTITNAFKNETDRFHEHLLHPVISAALMQPAGAFVTLHTKTGQLRGCIGRITTPDALCKTVHDMALAAAFNDTRFSPLTEQEFANISIEISVLTPPVPAAGPSDVIIGRHGIVLNKHNDQGAVIASSVFLPNVPKDYKWDIWQTLEQLSLKAGLEPDAWKEKCTLQVFESVMIHE